MSERCVPTSIGFGGAYETVPPDRFRLARSGVTGPNACVLWFLIGVGSMACPKFSFSNISDFGSLLRAYGKARAGKSGVESVCAFDFNLENELLLLKYLLETGRYRPSSYTCFQISDPKPRLVSAPAFRDRIVQHSVVAVVGPVFERMFIADSYACRVGKGTHYAAHRVRGFLMGAREKYGNDAILYVLQCDIRKYFQNVDWDILLSMLDRRIPCREIFDLVQKIVTTHDDGSRTPSVDGLPSPVSVVDRRGLPIGNLTSQLFANVYLDRLDHFIKEKLHEKWYGRYMDDFLIIHPDKAYLRYVRERIRDFLWRELRLELHPKKTIIRDVREGIPFVGYRIFHDHMMIRGSTLIRTRRNYRRKKAMAKKGVISEESLKRTEMSIRGHFGHASTKGLSRRMFGKKKQDH